MDILSLIQDSSDIILSLVYRVCCVGCNTLTDRVSVHANGCIQCTITSKREAAVSELAFNLVKMYFHKLQNIVVQIDKCSCHSCKFYLFTHCVWFCNVQLHPRGREAVSELAFNLVKMYLSKLTNVFVKIEIWTCPIWLILLSNCQIYLSKLTNLFVQIDKYICPK